MKIIQTAIIALLGAFSLSSWAGGDPPSVGLFSGQISKANIDHVDANAYSIDMLGGIGVDDVVLGGGAGLLYVPNGDYNKDGMTGDYKAYGGKFLLGGASVYFKKLLTTFGLGVSYVKQETDARSATDSYHHKDSGAGFYGSISASYMLTSSFAIRASYERWNKDINTVGVKLTYISQ